VFKGLMASFMSVCTVTMRCYKDMHLRYGRSLKIWMQATGYGRG